MLTSTTAARAAELALIDAAVAAGRVTHLPPIGQLDAWSAESGASAALLAPRIIRDLLDLGCSCAEIGRAIGKRIQPSGSRASHQHMSAATADLIVDAAHPGGALRRLRDRQIEKRRLALEAAAQLSPAPRAASQRRAYRRRVYGA